MPTNELYGKKSAKIVGKSGFRYRKDFIRPEPELINEIKALMSQTGCLTGNIGDSLNRMAGMDSRIKPIVPGAKILGPALTVKVPAGDNLMIHKAMTLIQPGDVLAIDGGGDRSRALLGWLMVQGLMKIGAVGIVLDGVIRDSEEIRESKYPVFSAGISPNGPFKEGPGEINFSITCGGKVVDPGDLIVADSDGVVVIPKDMLAECIEKTKKIINMEIQITNNLEKYAQGRPLLPNLKQILKNKGIE